MAKRAQVFSTRFGRSGRNRPSAHGHQLHDGPWEIRIGGAPVGVAWATDVGYTNERWATRAGFAWLGGATVWEVRPCVGDTLPFQPTACALLDVTEQSAAGSGACNPFGTSPYNLTFHPDACAADTSDHRYHASGDYTVECRSATAGFLKRARWRVSGPTNGVYTETFTLEPGFRWPHQTGGFWWTVSAGNPTLTNPCATSVTFKVRRG